MAAHRSLDGLGILLALVLALIATVVVLLAPLHRWGPEMWPFYLGTTCVLLWVAIDLWTKLRKRPGDAGEAAAELDDADLLVLDREAEDLTLPADRAGR